MVSARDVNPEGLIEALAGKMKAMPEIEAPEWASLVKTGAHAERAPENPDWWFVRSASVLRKVYMESPVGVGKLRKWYGGRKNRGSKPERKVNAGGAIIRNVLQQLEKAGLIEKKKGTAGRSITAKGRSLVDKTAQEITKG
jgi:small subunit ribosomal protein S19e